MGELCTWMGFGVEENLATNVIPEVSFINRCKRGNVSAERKFVAWNSHSVAISDPTEHRGNTATTAGKRTEVFDNKDKEPS